MVFWIMLLWVFAIWYFVQPSMSSRVLRSDGVYDEQLSTGYCILIFSLPLVFIALRSSFGDTDAYVGIFKGAPLVMSRFDEFVNTRDHSQLYYGLMMIFKIYIVDDFQVWFALVAIIQTVLMVKIFKEYSPDVGMSLFLFVVSGMSVMWMCNGMRQFLAVTILFACTKWILENKWYIFMPIAIIVMGFTPITSKLGLETPPWYMCGIHQSAMIFILSYFVIRGKAFNKKVWILIAVFVVLIFSGGLDSVLDSSVEDTTYVKDMHNVNADDGTSIPRVLVGSVPFVLALFARKEFDKETTPPVIHLAANCSAITSVLYIASAFTSGIYVGRLPVYTEMYSLILVPWLIKHAYKDNQKSITVAMIIAYTIYFYYQFNVTWGSLNYVSEVLGIGVNK